MVKNAKAFPYCLYDQPNKNQPIEDNLDGSFMALSDTGRSNDQWGNRWLLLEPSKNLDPGVDKLFIDENTKLREIKNMDMR
jgi:hypothetical protein